MLKPISLFLTFIIIIFDSQIVWSDEYENPLDPLQVKNISVITLEKMNKVTATCNIQNNKPFSYWPLTTSFVELVDGLVKKELKKQNYQTPFNKPIHKQYLGIQTENNQSLVYIFVYPKPSRIITEEKGNPVLLCNKNSEHKRIFEFDKNSFKFRLVNI